MPAHTFAEISNRIILCCKMKTLNPIKYFFETKKLLDSKPVVPLENLKMVAPFERKPEEIPLPWRQWLFPDYVEDDTEEVNLT